MSNTIAAIATPFGTGAIGVIRLSGDDSLNIANQVFSTKKLDSFAMPPLIICILANLIVKLFAIIVLQFILKNHILSLVKMLLNFSVMVA